MKLVAAALVLAPLATLATAVAAQAPAPALAPAKPSAAEIDAYLRGNREAGTFFGAMKELYPADYAKFIDVLLAAAARSANSQEAFSGGFAWSRRFFASKMQYMVAADAKILKALAATNHRFVLHLQKENLPSCAEYSSTGFSAGSPKPSDSEVRLLNEINVLQLRAAKSGELKEGPVRSGLDEKDSEAWLQRVDRLDPKTARLLESGSVGTTHEEQCAVGVALYGAVLELPEDQAARVMAHLLKSGSEAQN